VFFVSNIVKFVVFASAIFFFCTIVFGRFLSTPLGEWPQLWLETRGAAIVSLVILTFFSFIMLLVDTLIRSDAIDLLGTNLPAVSGVIAVLAGFEALIAASFGIAFLAGLLSVSRAVEFMAMLLFAIVAAVILSFLHSYLLLVRFSAIGIMRRDVVEV